MKKKYNKKINQYTLKGELICTFDNVKDASNITHYDALVNCCLKKTKTAGGFVWRFEGDEFSLKSSRDKKSTTTCKICSSNETIRSMSMHFKLVHNIKTEEYIIKYGEFRPKNLTYNIKIEKSTTTCKICNVKVKSHQHLMYHLIKIHPELTKHDYITQHVLETDVPTCKCGCGQRVTFLPNGKDNDRNKDSYFREYVKGHWDWEVFSTISKQSKEEIELTDFIKSIYNKEIQTSVRKIIKNREIDIYLPDLKLGIEYNGLYWHSEKGGRFKDYHVDKMKKAQLCNIRLIQIFSDEWINKKDIVKAKLTSIIGEKIKGIYARKCIVKEISSSEKNSFLNTHHIQGEDRSQIKLGLYYNNELKAVMTFSNPRISLGGNSNVKNIYELSRYASSSYIIGGASKLIKFFKEKFTPKEIYSYSDNRWTDPNNNMYLKMGFTKSKTSSPNYFYTKNYLIRLHRYNFNKFKLKNMGADTKNKTEFQIMEEMKYTKIWDCGTTKYTLC